MSLRLQGRVRRTSSRDARFRASVVAGGVVVMAGSLNEMACVMVSVFFLGFNAFLRKVLEQAQSDDEREGPLPAAKPSTGWRIRLSPSFATSAARALAIVLSLSPCPSIASPLDSIRSAIIRLALRSRTPTRVWPSPVDADWATDSREERRAAA